MTADDVARLEVIVPPRFGVERKERDAAERLMKLFAKRPRTGPTTGEIDV
jgi:hypothetical protein